MKGPTCFLGLLVATLSLTGAFLSPTQPQTHHVIRFAADKVEVCGFKDCRARGGGKRLQNLVEEIVEEKSLETVVEKCDCQGECGYGPNIVVDDKLINGVRGREAVMLALGIEE